MRRARHYLGMVLSVFLVGCSALQYYAQSIQGHFDVLRQSQSIEHLIADGNLEPELHSKLLLVLQAREFAVSTLELAFNDSYSHYADLDRAYVVKNLFAAEEFSTQLHSWCYPLIGCAGYRGYFDEEMLTNYQMSLANSGYDTYIADVTAYSTLGWFDDPVLNTFIKLPDYKLVGLIFHELAHQQIYIQNDTTFNESFAMAVERAGLEQFYSAAGESDELRQYRENQVRQNEMLDAAARARERLEGIYQQPLDIAKKRQLKEAVLQNIEKLYAALSQGKSNDSNTGGLNVEKFNNARLGAMIAYHEYVSAFLGILRAHDRSFPRFYAHVRKLGELNRQDREQCLKLWSADPGPADTRPAQCRA